jgi:hypothetical protein
MANIFKPKRSSTANSVPTTANLVDGELAVNTADQKIYIRSGASIVTVGSVGGGSGTNYWTQTSSGINTSSNVGIGTTNPIGQLQVSTGPVFIGTATSTGTASQPLQVTGGAYISGSLGVGRANPAGVSSAFTEIYYESGDPANATTALQVGMGGYLSNTNTIRQYGIKVNQLGGRYAPQTGIRVDIPGTNGLFGGPYYGIESYTICSSIAVSYTHLRAHET